jgi:hypothetical protein
LHLVGILFPHAIQYKFKGINISPTDCQLFSKQSAIFIPQFSNLINTVDVLHFIWIRIKANIVLLSLKKMECTMKRLAELPICDWYCANLRLSFFLSSKFVTDNCLGRISLGM